MLLNLIKTIPNQVAQDDQAVKENQEQKKNTFQLKDLLTDQIKQNEEINNDIPMITAANCQQSSENLKDQKKTQGLSKSKFNLKKFVDKKKSKTQVFVASFLQNMKIMDNKTTVNKSKIIYVNDRDKIKRVERLKDPDAEFIYPKTIIHYNSTYKHTWDIIILIAVIIVAIIAPLEIGFNVVIFGDFEYFLTALFVIDVFVCLRSTYIDENKDEIVDPKLLVIQYCKSVNFYIDVLGSIPFSDFFDDSNSEIRLIKLLKILRLLKISKLLQLLQNEKLRYISAFFNIIVVYIIILHWISCVWFFMAESDQKKILPTENGLKYKWQPVQYTQIYREEALMQSGHNFYHRNITSVGEQYIYTFYCVVQLVSGADNNPINYTQAFFLLSMVIFAQITIAAMFGNMSLLIFKMNINSEYKNSLLDNLNFQITQCKIQDETADKIMTYFEHCWKKNLIFQPELCNFNDVSHTLQRECLLIIHQDSVTRVPLFSQLEIQEVLSLIKMLKTHVYMPQDLLYQKDRVMTEMHFITDGLIEELNVEENEELIEFQKNNPQIMQIMGADSVKSESDYVDPKKTDQIQLLLQNHLSQLSSKQQQQPDIESSTQNPPDIVLKFPNMLTRKKIHRKGDFLGELCLYFLTSSENDFQASSFVTTETLSRKDFKKLSKEYKGMNLRLKQGLNQYKDLRKQQITKLMRETLLFMGVQQSIIEEFYFQHSLFKYFQTFDIIIKQEQHVEGYYLILKGSVQVCFYEYLKTSQFECLDDKIDTILDPQTIYMQDQDIYFKSVQILTPGDVFGIFNMGQKKFKYLSKFYYIARESTEILFIKNKNFYDHDKYQISDQDLNIILENDSNINKTSLYLEIPTGNTEKIQKEEKNNKSKKNLQIHQEKIEKDEQNNKFEKVPAIIQAHVLPLAAQESKVQQILPKSNPTQQQLQQKKPVQNNNIIINSQQLKHEIDNLKQKIPDQPPSELIQKTNNETLIFQYLGLISQILADQQKDMTNLKQKIIQQNKKKVN